MVFEKVTSSASKRECCAAIQGEDQSEIHDSMEHEPRKVARRGELDRNSFGSNSRRSITLSVLQAMGGSLSDSCSLVGDEESSSCLDKSVPIASLSSRHFESLSSILQDSTKSINEEDVPPKRVRRRKSRTNKRWTLEELFGSSERRANMSASSLVDAMNRIDMGNKRALAVRSVGNPAA